MHKSITRKIFVLLMTLCVVMSYFPMAFAADEVTNDSQGAKNAAAEEVQDKADEAKPKEDPQPEKKAEEAPKAEEPKAEPAAQDKADEGKTDEAKPAENKTDEAKPVDEADADKAESKQDESGKTDEAKPAEGNAEETQEEPAAAEEDVLPEEVEEDLAEDTDDINHLFTTKRSNVSDGDKINYTVTRIGEDNHKPSFHVSGDNTYYGICYEAGTPADDNGGKANLTKVANTSLLAKVAYYVGPYKNWWPTGKGNDNTSDEDKRNSRINLAERCMQYAGNPTRALNRMHELNYSDETINKIKGYVEEANGLTIPASFECYKAVPTNHDVGDSGQPFVLYKYHGGNLYLTKKAVKTATNFPSNYTLAGAVYYVYTDQACTKRALDKKLNPITFTTDASGNTSTIEVPSGTYYAKEITPSRGFKLDPNVRTATVNDSGTGHFESLEDWDSSRVYIQKVAKTTDTNFVSVAPNNYTLAGAVYYLFTDAACTIRAKDINSKEIVLTTTALGITNVVELEPGTYYAKEMTASKGFELDKVLNSGTGNRIVAEANKTASITSTEPPAHGKFELTLEKFNKKFSANRLVGAEYTLSWYDIDLGYADTQPTAATIAGKEPKKQWVFKTKLSEDTPPKAVIDFTKDEPISGGEMFKVDGDTILPNGVFTIQETKCPRGVGADPNVYYGKVQQPAQGQSSKSAVYNTESDDPDAGKLSIKITEDRIDMVNEEPRKRAVIKLKKVTIDENGKVIEDLSEVIKNEDGTTRSVAIPSLEGAEYEVYMVDPLYEEDQYCGKIVTDADGNGELTTDEHDPDKKLDAGSYYVVETKPAPGHALDKAAADKQEGEYRDGKHIVLVRFSESSDELVYEFEVRSQDPLITGYFHKTDVTSDCPELEGAKLQVLTPDEDIVEEWTSKADEPHKIEGLPSGTYILREITAPYGYDQAEDVEFTVVNDVVQQHVHMDNKPIKIKTNAVDDATKTRIGKFSDKEKVIDTVTFENLYAGRLYTFEGTLMDKNESTPENPVPLKDKDGNKVTAEKTVMFDENGKVVEEYNGEKGVLISGSVDLEFEFDASEFTKEKVVVAFEKIKREDNELASHADLNDEDQTIHFGGIVETVATDAETKSHNILAGKNAKIVDKVTYKNLAPGETYVIRGQLYDKTTGNVIEGVKAEPVTFTAEATDGTVEMTFTFDATGLETHTLVAYEELFVKATIDGQDKEVFVDEHKDPEDEDQTVWVPQIRTNATDLKTGDHIANANDTVTVKDVVTYKNLIPGKTYEMKGKLMDKQTRKVLKVNGKEVTASRTFTPKTPDGSVELTFSFKGNDFAGKSVVAFETCTIIGGGPTPVAVHEDFNDADQTVQLPKIATKAGKKNSDGYIVDTVKYWNLIPGREYIVRGYLVKKSNGDEIADSEGEFRFTPSTPNGKVYVELDPGDATGKLVAFEEIYIIDTKSGTPREILVGEHADRNDKAQTVNVPSKHKKPKTGDDVMFIFIGGIFGLSAALYLVLRRRQKMMNK